MLALIWLVFLTPAFAATFGTVTTVVGSISDIVLDEPRRRLYLVNSSQNRVEVYSIPPSPTRLLSSIATDPLPLSAAMSWDGQFLYVTSFDASALNIIDLNTFQIVGRPSLPARPEGIAVGNDGRALITTIGTGPGNTQNVLLIYDPADNGRVYNVVVTPPAPQSPLLPPPSGRAFLTNRSQLRASDDGSIIVGANITSNTTRVVFVYEVASGTVLRSRGIANVSGVLAISPDNSKFMSGLTLFDTQTLEVLAQQNLANAPYPIQPGTNFNLIQNQGGSIFSPDGTLLYSAFNVAPFQNPPARPNVSQLMLNDPDNLLIHMALQMPENLAGKMVITSDGGTIFAISESGFTAIPIGTANRNPIVDLSTRVVHLANDQCGVTANQRQATVAVRNLGQGRVTATAQVLQMTPVGPGGLGGAGGPGGGLPGGGVIIVIPPAVPGGGQPPAGPQLPGGGGGQQNAAIFQTAPSVRVSQSPDGPLIQLSFNSLNTRGLGTASPIHDFLIQSNEAINIPPVLRVYQNNRNAEASTDVRPIPVGISANEGLADIVYDPARDRVYIANSGMNRIEVFDARAKEFLPPIKVGQLPRSIALSPDSRLLYVANTGGENISIVDLDEGRVVDRVHFPPLPLNLTTALVTPSVIAATQRGPLIIMSNGTIWKVVGNEAIPRAVSPVIGSSTVQQPRTMVATPNGEYALLLAGNGFAYLYDAVADEFVQGRQIFNAPIQGYYGPVGAGPGGRYFLVNGVVLNAALTPIGNAGSVIAGAQGAAIARPVAAVAPLSLTSYVRFTQPLRLQANNPIVNDVPVVEIANAANGNTMRAVPSVEGPLSIQTGNQRVNVPGRMMAVDPSGSTAYLLTASGLSVVPLDTPPPAQRPFINPNGVVNIANFTTAVSPGGVVSIYGRNLAETASTESTPLPTILGGVCVTLNNRPMPILLTSPEQINVQIPPELAPGRYPLVVRSIQANTTSTTYQVTVSKYAPAVLTDVANKQPAIYHADGRPVNRQNPATRDERLTLFAVGLGPVKGGALRAGEPPTDPLPTVDPVSVFFGDPRIRESAIAVEWSGLAPGLIGIYQVNLYVPGYRLRGDELDVTVRVGGVDSPTTGELAPKVALR